MSKYTTEVRFICETAVGLDNSKGYSSVNEIIDNAIPKIFDFDFPIFDSNYKPILLRKILKHYYTREISEETVGLWKLRLDTKLNEIMPLYNKLYLSELLEFNPLYTTDLTRTRKGKIDKGENEISESTTENTITNEKSNTSENTTNVSGKNSSNSTNNSNFNNITNGSSTTESHGEGSGTSNNENVDKFSETPQGALTNVENGTYLTTARIVDDNGSNTSITNNSGSGSTFTSGNGSSNSLDYSYSDNLTNGSSNTTFNETETTNNSTTNHATNDNTSQTTEDYLENVVGYDGRSASKSLKEYRETFLNIDMMVIDELETLFFNLW